MISSANYNDKCGTLGEQYDNTKITYISYTQVKNVDSLCIPYETTHIETHDKGDILSLIHIIYIVNMQMRIIKKLMQNSGQNASKNT